MMISEGPEKSLLKASPLTRARLEDQVNLHSQILNCIGQSAQDEEQFCHSRLRAGAADYLSKANSPAELVKGVQKVLAGGRYVSERFAEALALALQRGTEPHSHQS